MNDVEKHMMDAILRERFLIETLIEKSVKTDTDIKEMRKILEALGKRVKSLTPHRKDLSDAWDSAYDLDIIENMFKHNAADKSDADQLIRIVFDRLKMMCAPIQDEAVRHAEETLLNETDLGRKVSSLIQISNHILDDIEDLNARLS